MVIDVKIYHQPKPTLKILSSGIRCGPKSASPAFIWYIYIYWFLSHYFALFCLTWRHIYSPSSFTIGLESIFRRHDVHCESELNWTLLQSWNWNMPIMWLYQIKTRSICQTFNNINRRFCWCLFRYVDAEDDVHASVYLWANNSNNQGLDDCIETSTQVSGCNRTFPTQRSMNNNGFIQG